jgi:hypothetical protein
VEDVTEVRRFVGFHDSQYAYGCFLVCDAVYFVIRRRFKGSCFRQHHDNGHSRYTTARIHGVTYHKTAASIHHYWPVFHIKRYVYRLRTKLKFGGEISDSIHWRFKCNKFRDSPVSIVIRSRVGWQKNRGSNLDKGKAPKLALSPSPTPPPLCYSFGTGGFFPPDLKRPGRETCAEDKIVYETEHSIPHMPSWHMLS